MKKFLIRISSIPFLLIATIILLIKIAYWIISGYWFIVDFMDKWETEIFKNCNSI